MVQSTYKKRASAQDESEKAAEVTPSPMKQPRPIVRWPTFSYNVKQRAGQGCSLEELKTARVSTNMVSDNIR